MGSRNTDGTAISQSRKTVRNLGAAHTISADRVESSVRLDAEVDLSSNADLTLTQYSVVTHASYLKTTDSREDALIARDAAIQDKPATDVEEGQHASRHTGNRIVVSESMEDDVISREADTGSYD